MKNNHHYVPQFYLRNFSHNKKNISMYLKSSRKFIEMANIKGQAYKQHLYGETEDLENTLMTIEHKASIVINKIINELQTQLSHPQIIHRC